MYTASALASGGKLFNAVFGIDYHVALAIGAVVILVYTFLGGFLAVCTTDFVQGLLMLVGLMVVPVCAYSFIDGSFEAQVTASGITGSYSDYMSLFSNGGKPYRFIDILSQLAWGLGYCGMPHILVRFMAIKSEKEIKKSSAVAIIWCFLSLVAACIIGVLGRAYFGSDVLKDAENVFIEMINSVFNSKLALPFIGGIFICGILAAIMSTADSQLLVCASSVSKDIYKNIIKPSASDKKVLQISRITVIIVAVLAFIIAWNPESSIMGLVSDAWAGLGSAFGPLVVASLFWKRTNLYGAVAGILSGGITVIIWDYIPLAGGRTIYAATGIYSLLVGFVVSFAFIIVASLCTKAPGQDIVDEFERAKKEAD